MIVRRLVRALDDRLRFASLARTALAKVFPDHWSFMLGEIALYSFTALILTGIYLSLFFDASLADTVYRGDYAPLDGATVSAAYASTVQLSWDVRAGLLMRQAHHWAALIFAAAIVVHMARVFFTGAFRKPRELNWVVGLTMLIFAFLNGFAGYSMPDDLLSGVGLQVAYGITLSVPVAGEWLASWIWGGEFPGEVIARRLYIAHVFLIPALLAVLISVHMAILVRQKHSQFPGPGRTEHNVVGSKLWPGYAFRSLGLFGAVMAMVFALGGLAQINPVWLYGPFEVGSVTAPAQPDWYVGWIDGALRLWPAWEVRAFGYTVPNPFFPAVLMPGVVFLILYAWPFLEPLVTGDRDPHQLLERPRAHPGRVAFGWWAATAALLLLVASASDLIAKETNWPVGGIIWALRIAVLAVPVLAAAIAFVLARALRDSGADGVLELSAAELTLGWRRRRPRRPSGRGVPAPVAGGAGTGPPAGKRRR